MNDFLSILGIKEVNSGVCGREWNPKPTGGELVSYNPTTGKPIATVLTASPEDYDQVVKDAQQAFETWSMIPAPKRGQIIRQIGEVLRKHKKELGALVSLEMGKIIAEGEGEVQEMIDMADFAVGLSRQLYGLTIQSERPAHRMYEQWLPLGPIGIITAFNFPVAVWAWNATVAAVCGDTMLWKPSSKTPLCAIAVQNLINPVLEAYGAKGVMNLVIGSGANVGERMIADKRIRLISATGSVQMGRRVAEVVGKRLGKTILELGGNNAIIVMDDANLDLAERAILFAAIGTAGQRCTTLRRLLIHENVYDELLNRLVNAYKQVKIGDPLDPQTLMGPLVDRQAVEIMQQAIKRIQHEGGEIIYGGKVLQGEKYTSGCFVQPTIVKAHPQMAILKEETFAPILYVIKFAKLDQAIQWHNDVPQGLSSSIFTNSIMAAELFLSPKGSDCGIANVNIGTSGAEIGGAFGGEKDTGGGREAGSDAWKAYMRRQTCTINWSEELPLAQGITFGQ